MSFCRKASPGQMPVLVPHKPIAGKPLKECFSIVSEHIEAKGGRQVFGWAIFELKKIWLEAEFHVVWESEDGQLVDLTPREVPIDKILFLPDPNKKYEGTQVNSIFHAISNKPSVKRFIALSKEYYQAVNEGKLAKVQSGYIESLKAIGIQQEMDQLIPQIMQEHQRNA